MMGDGAVDVFDLIEFQQEARSTDMPKKLFELWEEVCRRYDRGFIGKYELEEMKAVIYPKLRAMAALRNQLSKGKSSNIARVA